MTSFAMGNTNDDDRADRALRWIGDLDHPFYSDERNRYVWYEASAIGFQMLFIANFFAAGLMMLIGGAAALPYGLALVAICIVTSVVVQSYVGRRKAEFVPSLGDILRRRGLVAVAASGLLILGLARAFLDVEGGDGAWGSFTSGVGEGAAAGLVTGVVAAVALMVYKARSSDEGDER